MNDKQQLAFHPLSPFGAEVTGIDLRSELTGEAGTRLHDAWKRYGLLLFRGQTLSKEDQVRVLRVFGDLSEQGVAPGGVNYVTNVAERGLSATGEMNLYSVGALQFHFDHPFHEHPLRGLTLYAIEVPPPEKGGETLFSDARIAYRLMPAPLRSKIASLRVRYSPKERSAVDRGTAEHPLVLDHPETGEKLLFLSRWHADAIVGLNAAEGEELMDELISYVARDEAIYRHTWRPGDLVVWDNLALQHARTGYDTTFPRHLRKAQIA